MRALVATTELQGVVPGDYCWTVEGELVAVDVIECAEPDRCGCGRGFAGIASRRATTTAMVVDLPHLTRSDLIDVVADHVDLHWRDLLIAGVDPDDPESEATVEEQLAEITDEYVDDIELICGRFPVGSVIERQGTLITARSYPFAA